MRSCRSDVSPLPPPGSMLVDVCHWKWPAERNRKKKSSPSTLIWGGAGGARSAFNCYADSFYSLTLSRATSFHIFTFPDFSSHLWTPNFHRNAALAVQTQKKVVRNCFALLPHLLARVGGTFCNSKSPFRQTWAPLTGSSKHSLR